MDKREIKLRWIDVNEILGGSLLAEAQNLPVVKELKSETLARLGIEHKENENYLQAWARTMAEENGLPVEIPVVEKLRKAVEAMPDAMKFASSNGFRG